MRLQWWLHFSKGDIITTAYINSTPASFKNCTPFTKCIKSIDSATIDDAEDLRSGHEGVQLDGI